MHDVQLVYYSESRLTTQDGPLLGQLRGIAGASADNNRRRAITGALAFDDIWFLQVLEGKREAVWSTFRRILDDPRHDEAVLVECTPIEQRRFGDWAMRLVTPTAAANRHLAPFKTGGLLRPNRMSGADIVAALAAMIAGEARLSRVAGEQERAGLVPRTAAVAP